jgi:hypothetical protein
MHEPSPHSASRQGFGQQFVPSSLSLACGAFFAFGAPTPAGQRSTLRRRDSLVSKVGRISELGSLCSERRASFEYWWRVFCSRITLSELESLINTNLPPSQLLY